MNKRQKGIVRALRDKGVPAEWAILIAERDNGHCQHDPKQMDPADCLISSFVFHDTAEGQEFWWTAYCGFMDEDRQSRLRGGL